MKADRDDDIRQISGDMLHKEMIRGQNLIVGPWGFIYWAFLSDQRHQVARNQVDSVR